VASLKMVTSLENLRRHIPDEFIPAELGGSCNYRFNMEDYPSPFAENYNSMLAGYAGEVNDKVLLDDLYYPDTGDDVDGAALTQASVGHSFSGPSWASPASARSDSDPVSKLTAAHAAAMGNGGVRESSWSGQAAPAVTGEPRDSTCPALVCT
jgi:hypothetical protein